METTTRVEDGWLIVALAGDASAERAATWRELRESVPWDRSRWVILDVLGVEGASDRYVETIIGIAADAHNQGGVLALVGENEDTRRRFGALGVADYVHVAETIQQAKDSLPGPDENDRT